MRFRIGNDFTQADLRDWLYYNPRTGKWFWKQTNSYCPHIKPGDETGKPNKKGICLIAFCGKQYHASRLAWFYMTGQWPALYVDHKNRNTADNRWSNLRLATHGQNRANSKSSNKTGYKGVVQSGNRFMAVCAKKYLGMFATAQKAHAAYMKEAKSRYSEFACDGGRL